MARTEPSPTLPRWAGLPVSGSLALLSLTVAAFAIEIEVEDGLVSIEAAHEPLDVVIENLANESGFRLIWQEPLQRRVDVRYHRRPLPDALNELLQTESYLLLLPDPSDARGERPSVPATLWIFPDGSGEAVSAAEFLETVLLQGRIGEKKAAIRELRRLDTAAAVESLGDFGDTRSRDIIQDALSDPDPGVRRRAVEILEELDDEAMFRALFSAE